MRRPTVCSDTASADDCYSSAPHRSAPEKDEGRLSRMKRILAGTLLLGRRGRTFGLRLDELPTGGRDGVPKVVVRLCAYIESHGMQCGGLFRLSAGNPKLVERLRSSFDRNGDADLEAAGDAASVASLLKLWLRELPEPIILAPVVLQLLEIHEKLHDVESTQWQESVCQAMTSLPDPNIRVLRHLLRFLRHYEQHVAVRAQCHHHTTGGVAAVFGPLLILSAVERVHQSTAQQLTARLIREAHNIFPECLVEHTIQAAVSGGPLHLFAPGSVAASGSDQPTNKHRKRKERNESFSSQTQDRKVIRSNSEERPLEDGSVSGKDSIRRVSSHEDFSHANKSRNNVGSINTITDVGEPAKRVGSLPLHEHNSAGSTKSSPVCAEAEPSCQVPVDFLDDLEHERRRSSERFARAMTPRGRRNLARRRRIIHKAPRTEDAEGSRATKENEMQEVSHNIHHVAAQVEDDGGASSAHSFLQLHPQERERSPSPSPSPCTPPVDLSTLHQLVDCNEPLRSMGNWSFAHRQPDVELSSSQVMLSPRNSMILARRVYSDPNAPPSPPHEHVAPSEGDAKLKLISRQVHNLKKRMKHFEEEFEDRFGYRPSHADKISNKETKKLYAELTKLRKEMKNLKEDPLGDGMQDPSGGPGSHGAHYSGKTREDTLQEVEKHLTEKREEAGRPPDLGCLSREQLMEEKVAVQKALLYLESVFGRPVTKTDRDLVRPLYDRYRTLKRLVIRTTGKLKDSGFELATILEHETMDFISSPPSLSAQEESGESGDTCEEATDSSLQAQVEANGALWENLHALPLSELLEQQRSTREEKKKLRRSLREFEEEFQRCTGRKLQREDRAPVETTYGSYKQTKAKLRLLDALVSKHTAGT